MLADQGVPCLLFLVIDGLSEDAEKRENPSTQPPVKGYALIPPAFKNNQPQVSEHFSCHHIRVVSKIQDEPSLPMRTKKTILRLFETQLYLRSTKTEDDSSNSPTSMRVCVDARCSGNYFDEFGDVFEFSDKIHFTEDLSEENLETVGKFLSPGAHIEYGHHKGGTILHFAVKRCQEALVKLLLRGGVDVKAGRQLNSCEPLFLAAKKEFSQIVDLLTTAYDSESYMTRIWLDDYWGFERDMVHKTPLNMTFYQRHPKAFKLLLKFRAKAYSDTLHYYAIPYFLREAVDAHLQDFVEIILSHNPIVNDEYNIITFHMAFLHRGKGAEQMQCFEKMKKNGFQMSGTQGLMYDIEAPHLLLFGAIMENWVEVVEVLVKEGVDVNQPLSHNCGKNLPWLSSNQGFAILCDRQEYTPLHMAAIRAGEEIVKLLLKHGADINTELEGRAPIYDAIQAHNTNVIQLLLDSKANVLHNPDLMCCAVKYGNSQIVKALLRNRTPLKGDKGELQRFLRVAAAADNIEAICALFDLGAQPDKDFGMECTGFEYHEGHSETLRTLLDLSFSGVNLTDATKIICFLDKEYAARNPSSLICSHCREDIKPCFNAVARHVIKRKSAELSLTQQNIVSIWQSEASIDEFCQNCEAEVTMLKKEKVGSSDTTFYDVLTKNANHLALCAKHKDFISTYTLGDYRNKFPIYASILGYQFVKGACRRALLDRSSEVCSLLSSTFNDLPDIIKEKIVKYLSSYDLEVLVHEFDQFAASTDKI